MQCEKYRSNTAEDEEPSNQLTLFIERLWRIRISPVGQSLPYRFRIVITSYDNIYFIITRDNDDIRYLNILLFHWKLGCSENVTKDL